MINENRGLTRWVRFQHDDTPIWIQPETPDWLVPNRRADIILSALASGSDLQQAAARYGAEFNIDPAVAPNHVTHLLERVSIRQPAPIVPRNERLSLEGLRELWIHLTNRCNLRCTHCLFASSPDAGPELPSETVQRMIDEAAGLGCRLVYATGGEPMISDAYPALCRSIAQRPDTHLVTLTNALPVPRMRSLLDQLPRDRFHFQVSLDGPEAVHDRLRGRGTFERTRACITDLQDLGFPVALAMVVDRSSTEFMDWLVDEAARLGVPSIHYLWYFVKGQGSNEELPEVGDITARLHRAHERATAAGVTIDNIEILRSQVLSVPGTRYDLTNAGWQSVAVGPDGQVYPTAALVLENELACGHVSDGLERVWRQSETLDSIRRASVADGPQIAAHPMSFLTGGGDPDHSFVSGGRFVGADPWIDLYERVALSLIAEQAGPEDAVEAPAFRARMGERLETCNQDDALCAFTHSNCVLSVASEDGHALARDFYDAAAARPNEDILNPVGYQDATEAALPSTATSRSYGCGSPVLDAGIEPGDTIVDLGCGAGVELCVAAETVGETGRVIGIDMLDDMLQLARTSASEMATRLGYQNIELHKGFLETIPLPDGVADVVISNCVINLTEDKRRTFEEIRRVLRPGGRLVVADVCSEVEPPLSIQYNEKLRGECIGGALRQDILLGLLTDVGFEGISILKRFPYREVSGHPFFSLTYTASKPGDGRPVRGFYRGPFAAVLTDSGRLISRGHPVEFDEVDTRSDDSVFLLDQAGAVTNIDIGAGCACFVPPEADETPVRGQRAAEGCLVCAAPLEYLASPESMSCTYCGRDFNAGARCADGHFVCDSCHVGAAPEAILRVLETSRETDMIRLFEEVRRHPTMPIHGPEYHALVPAVIVAAARNAGLPLETRHIQSAIDRGTTVAGGSCGFMGACGAGLGVGIAFSVILGATPLTGAKRSLLHQITVSALDEIGRLDAARCCQRDSWTALKTAAEHAADVLGVSLEASVNLDCTQMAGNHDCLGAQCPYWPGNTGDGGPVSIVEHARLPVLTS